MPAALPSVRDLLPRCILAIGALLPLVMAGHASAQDWRAGGTDRAPTAAFAAADGRASVTIRCAPDRGYTEMRVLLQGEGLDLAPSPRGDGRMVDLSMLYRRESDEAVSGTQDLATVAARPGGHEFVSLSPANAMSIIAAEATKPAHFELRLAGRALQIPFVPAALAERLETACGFPDRRRRQRA